jgi:hypothetical protein
MLKQGTFLSQSRFFLSKAGDALREKGIGYVAGMGLYWLASPVIAPAVRVVKGRHTFELGGRSYPYFCHRYNLTWRNERIVEVPVIWELVQRFRGKRILEVGNVLSHYFPVEHDVLDKYERADGVLNQDLVDFRADGQYDLIVSISTLEHIGWDETPRDPGKVLRAIETLKACLRPGGTMLVTVPLGYNRDLDEHLRSGRLSFPVEHYLKRVSRDNQWREVPRERMNDARYGYPYLAANDLLFATFEKPAG